MSNKYLPIGSIVLLKDAQKKLMITGFCFVASDNQNIIYDYTGVSYPEGLIRSDEIALFNNNDIKEIYHQGYIDNDEIIFKDQLNKLVNK